MEYDAIRIVLVGTTHPGNIGSVARAMKTMGFDQLYLVDPKTLINQQSYDLAAGADDILNHVQVVSSIARCINRLSIWFWHQCKKKRYQFNAHLS